MHKICPSEPVVKYLQKVNRVRDPNSYLLTHLGIKSFLNSRSSHSYKRFLKATVKMSGYDFSLLPQRCRPNPDLKSQHSPLSTVRRSCRASFLPLGLFPRQSKTPSASRSLSQAIQDSFCLQVSLFSDCDSLPPAHSQLTVMLQNSSKYTTSSKKLSLNTQVSSPGSYLFHHPISFVALTTISHKPYLYIYCFCLLRSRS